MEILIGLLSGAVGGTTAGKLLSKIDQGTIINAVAGIVGGGLGSTILGAVGTGGMAGGGMDIAGIIGQVASGGIGGGVLLAIVGMIRNAIDK